MHLTMGRAGLRTMIPGEEAAAFALAQPVLEAIIADQSSWLTGSADENIRYLVHIDRKVRECLGTQREHRFKVFDAQYRDITPEIAAHLYAYDQTQTPRRYLTYTVKSYASGIGYTDPDRDLPDALACYGDEMHDLVLIEAPAFATQAQAHGVRIDLPRLYCDEPSADTPIPPDQLRSAAKLAHVYRHAWTILVNAAGQTPADLVLERGTGTTMAELRQLSITFEECCIGDPRYTVALDDNANVVYESEHRRARWSVAPDGTATVWIQRPSGDCLKLILALDKPPVVEQLAQVYPRHLAEAARFLEAYVTPLEADYALEAVVVTPDDPEEAEHRAQLRQGLWASDEPRPVEFGGRA
jgi:hypothetical protein